MNKYFLKAANSLVRRFGAEITQIKPANFSMQSAVQRIAQHEMPIRSIIDIGASNGSWSMAAMKTFPEVSFLAIEPLTEREKALENVKQSHRNFDYVLCVAGDVDGQLATLNITDDLDGSSINGKNGSRQRKVPVKTIDAIVAEKNMRGPYLLKFDTHGYEVPILNGAKETMGETAIVIMDVYNFKFTAHTLKFHEMCLYMEQLGFSCYDIAEPMLRLYDKAFWQMDLLFCRNNSAIFSYSQYR